MGQELAPLWPVGVVTREQGPQPSWWGPDEALLWISRTKKHCLCAAPKSSVQELSGLHPSVNAECRQPSCRAQTIALAPMGLLQGTDTGKHEYCKLIIYCVGKAWFLALSPWAFIYRPYLTCLFVQFGRCLSDSQVTGLYSHLIFKLTVRFRKW